MEPTLRSTQALKQEAEDIGLQGKDIAEYVTRQQPFNREERAAWRETQRYKHKQMSSWQRSEQKQTEQKQTEP